ncbi:hypothetical protein B0J12DRAFT_61526 [Macrophomina phaseolina]|uniref:F-box domain cyclin-like protein n=1 Tax=Macrophomina phaseolina TaxID=35725 RepID=A0ABQ8GCG8_9PEZI|nr:hypothetical protein B0J12DRAFT_61526 [Macrophomina phaseolina]
MPTEQQVRCSSCPALPTLPEEMIDLIISFADHGTQQQLRLCSKQFCRLATPRYFRQFRIRLSQLSLDGLIMIANHPVFSKYVQILEYNIEQLLWFFDFNHFLQGLHLQPSKYGPTTSKALAGFNKIHRSTMVPTARPQAHPHPVLHPRGPPPDLHPLRLRARHQRPLPLAPPLLPGRPPRQPPPPHLHPPPSRPGPPPQPPHHRHKRRRRTRHLAQPPVRPRLLPPPHHLHPHRTHLHPAPRPWRRRLSPAAPRPHPAPPHPRPPLRRRHALRRRRARAAVERQRSGKHLPPR